jgi:hypothetical protein
MSVRISDNCVACVRVYMRECVLCVCACVSVRVRV